MLRWVCPGAWVCSETAQDVAFFGLNYHSKLRFRGRSRTLYICGMKEAEHLHLVQRSGFSACKLGRHKSAGVRCGAFRLDVGVSTSSQWWQGFACLSL